MIAPAVIVYGAFFIAPLAQTAYLSFTDWNGVRATKDFIGLDNYVRMLDDPLFWLSLNVLCYGWLSEQSHRSSSVLDWACFSGRHPGQTMFQAIFFLPQYFPRWLSVLSGRRSIAQSEGCSTSRYGS